MTLPKPTLMLSPDGSYDRQGPIEPTVIGDTQVIPGRYGNAWEFPIGGGAGASTGTAGYVSEAEGSAIFRARDLPGGAGGNWLWTAGDWIEGQTFIGMTMDAGGVVAQLYNGEEYSAQTHVSVWVPADMSGPESAVYMEWTPEVVRIVAHDGQSSSIARPPLGNAVQGPIWLGGHYGDQHPNSTIEGALFFDRPLTEEERGELLSMGAWTHGELFEPSRITSVVAYGNGPYAASATLWRADRYGNLIEQVPISVPVNASIEFNEDTIPHRRMSIQVNDPEYLRPFRDFVVPELRLTDAMGNTRSRKMGHFMATMPTTLLTPASYTGSVEAHDITWLVANDQLDNGLVIPEGTDRGAAARDIILGTGFASKQVSIPDIGVLLNEDMIVDPGTTRYEVARELLEGGNWYAPWCHSDGYITTKPIVNLQDASPMATWSNAEGERVTIVPPIGETPDWSRLKNKQTVRNISPEKEAIYWTEVITDRNHPLFHDPNDPSTFPMWLAGPPENDSQIETEEEAMERAIALLGDAASFYRPIEASTIVDLDADAHQVIALDVFAAGKRYDGRWKRRAWTVNLHGLTATTQSQLWRVEKWRV